MPTRPNREYIRVNASLSQLAAKDNPILQMVSGTDQELSDAIAVIWLLGEEKILNEKDTRFLLRLLDVLRLSHFATSPSLNEISKLGFLMPKGQPVVDDYDEDSE